MRQRCADAPACGSAALAGGDKGYGGLQDSCIYVETVGGRLEMQSEKETGTIIVGESDTSHIDDNLRMAALQ